MYSNVLKQCSQAEGSISHHPVSAEGIVMDWKIPTSFLNIDEYMELHLIINKGLKISLIHPTSSHNGSQACGEASAGGQCHEEWHLPGL